MQHIQVNHLTNLRLYKGSVHHAFGYHWAEYSAYEEQPWLTRAGKDLKGILVKTADERSTFDTEAAKPLWEMALVNLMPPVNTFFMNLCEKIAQLVNSLPESKLSALRSLQLPSFGESNTKEIRVGVS